MASPGSAFEYASANLAGAVEALKELLRVPSISALPDHAADTRRAADLVAAMLDLAGLEEARAVGDPGGGYPVVRGDWLGAPGAPTLLLYGHYDVQPPDPLDEWVSPPFEPVERDGRVYARGADDNKGQLVAIIKGVEAVLKTAGRLPVNVKFLVEGEEESGGKALPSYLRDHAAEAAGDAVFVADSQWVTFDRPTIVTALRGLVYVEVEAAGARQDLHSGTYGGIAPNPLNALAWLLAELKGRDGRVRIPGFYDAVRPPGDVERQAWASLGIDEAALLRDEVGAAAYFGEEGQDLHERRWGRPTLDVHGIRGGFTGEGAKTVIPARATAKVSMRLVPAQDPRQVYEAFTRFVEDATPPGVTFTVRPINIDPPVEASPAGRGVKALARALERGFDRAPAFIRMGGSVPVTTAFHEALGVELLVTGFGLPDARLHSPNENFALSQLEGGIRSVAALLEEFGRQG